MNRASVRTAAAGLLAVLATARPAAADTSQDGQGNIFNVSPGDGLTALEALGIYVLAPLALMALVWALVWLPGVVRGPRYRPGRGWSAAPVWFAGPADPVAALERAQPPSESTAAASTVVWGGARGSW